MTIEQPESQPQPRKPRFRWLKNILVGCRILPRDDRPPLFGYVVKHMPVVLAILLITLILEKVGWFRGYETYALDAILNVYTPPAQATIVLVCIDDQDYETYFHGVSPLDPKEVHAAIADIHRGQPALIAVDLDTSNEQYAHFEWPEAVWYRSAKADLVESKRPLDQIYSSHAIDRIKRTRFLGGKGQEHLAPTEQGIIETTPRSGASMFLGDSDGVIRRFRQVFDSPSAIPPSPIHAYVESFPWAICRAYADYLQSTDRTNSEAYQHVRQEEHHSAHERAEDIILSFGGSRDRFLPLNLRTLKEAASKPYWEKNSPLKGNIVIFGGTYSAARDVYFTPVGPRYGIELIAHAVETGLSHRGVYEFEHLWAIAVDFLVGVFMLLILWRFPGYRAFITTMIAAAILALIASAIAFRSFAYWFNFVPMVGGLWMHYQWEKRKENQELHHELTALREELNKLTQ